MAKDKPKVKINGQKFKDGDLVTVVLQAKVHVSTWSRFDGTEQVDVSLVNASEADGEGVEAWPELDFEDQKKGAKKTDFRAPGVTLVRTES